MWCARQTFIAYDLRKALTCSDKISKTEATVSVFYAPIHWAMLWNFFWWHLPCWCPDSCHGKADSHRKPCVPADWSQHLGGRFERIRYQDCFCCCDHLVVRPLWERKREKKDSSKIHVLGVSMILVQQYFMAIIEIVQNHDLKKWPNFSHTGCIYRLPQIFKKSES